MSVTLRARYEDALRSLELLLEERPSVVHDAIEQATRHTVAVRDALIAARRDGENGHDDALRRVNALLSLIVAAEFPLVGVRWKRIESARDALAKLASEQG